MTEALNEKITRTREGWKIIKILRHFMSVNRFSPLTGSGYMELPANIQNKKATINIQNQDDKCFMYC